MKDVYNLTSPQKSILLTEEFYGKTNINNVCGTFYSNEKIDFELFKKAINIFLKNNDSFKIKLKQINGETKQYFCDIQSLDFDIVQVNNKEEQTALEEKIASEIFELYDSLLFKIVLFRYPDGHGGFVINSHHIISDSWTNGIVANDVALIYSKLKNGEDYSKDDCLSYKTYIESEKEYKQSSKFEKDKVYWNEVFTTIPEVATIPSIKEVSQEQDSTIANRLLLPFDNNLLYSLKKYCEENKVSLYNFFMSIYSLYIGRVSGLDEFVIGTPILNRTNFKEKQTTGMFINTLPLKINLTHENTFIENLKEIATRSMNLLRHQKYSFQYIIEDLRKKESSLPKLYNILYSYQITKMNKNMDALEHTTSWTFNKNIADDLDIHMFEWNDEGSIQISYDYRINKYNEQDILDLHARILHVIKQVIENKNILLKDIEIVTPEEKNKILYEFNNTKADYPKDKTIVNLFEEQVEKTPDNIAVVFEKQKLTYKELNEKANSLARYLITEKKIKNDNIVLILLDRSLEMIISILAVLKAGAAYLPIDPKYPKDRIQYIVEDSKCNLILTFSDLYKTKNEKTVYLDNSTNEIEKYSHNNLNIKINQENLSYIIYTSGSTGTPKGVILKHLSLSNLINYCNNYVEYLKTPNNMAVVSVTTVSFDIFIFETLISLQRGLKLVIANYDEQTLPDNLNRLIEKENIKAIQTTPSRMQILCNNLKNIPNLKRLEYITLAGEQLPITLLNKLNSITKAVIYNGYGPSETTVFATLTDVTDYKKITIGKPLPNTNIYILDRQKKLCPINTPGEIYISGDGVGYGYVGKKELTSNSFISDTFFAGNIMYKSGDIGYYSENGEITCLGRIDNQVKIRGLRIELEEIEKNLLSFNEISNCVVTKKIDKNLHEFLCAYFVSTKDIEISLLRDFLQKKLPKYMIPQYFVKLKTLPYTPNGKIDKKALPFPEVEIKNKSNTTRNEIDSILKNIYESELNQQNISIDDSFYELGGDSLSAINISIKIFNDIKIQVSVNNIFKYSTIHALSDYIFTIVEKNKYTSISTADTKDFYPLSSAQKRIYLSCLKDKNSLLYNISGGLLIDKEIDKNKLEKCFKELIKRHSSLRTHFESNGNEIFQIIDDNITFKLDYELSQLDDENSIYASFVKPFNLSTAPLFRAKLVKLKKGKNLLLLDIHHIISDGSSLNILLQELCTLYNDKNLPNKRIEYKDFAVWEQNKLEKNSFNKAKEYWINQFKDDIPLLNMPSVYPRPNIQSYQGDNYFAKLNSNIYNNIIKTAKEMNTTPFILLLSTYYVLLSKYTCQDDLIVGTTVSGRILPELSNLLGMFVNSLPLRNKVNDSYTFTELCTQINDNFLNAFKHQSYPFDKIVNDLKIKKDISRNPLFDTMFTFQSEGYKPVNFNGIKAKYFIPNNMVSKFDLTLEVVPMDNEYILRFEYCTKLYDENFIKRFSSHFINILNSILENRKIKISNINMLSEEEKMQILHDFNNTKTDYPKNKTVIELFEEQVRKTPDKTAVIFEDKKLTYKELNEKANQIARYLIEHNVKENSIIGIMLPRCIEIPIFILAVLKINCAYILIDTSLPEDRIINMLNQCNAKFLITCDIFKKLNFDNKFLKEDFVYSLNKNNLSIKINAKSPACIIFTSGSTGQPKGILLTHIGINNMVQNYVKNLNINICSTILSISSVAFDMFIVEIYISLLTGKTLILSNDEQQKIPIFTHDLIKKHNANFLLTTPSRIDLMLSQKLLDDLDSLKIIQLGGEVFTSDLYNRLSLVTSSNIYNGYGPSEITACCSNKLVTNSNITIGKPFDNFKIYILDKNNLLCPIGVPGQICISGDGVSLGYINRPDLTDKSFIKNPYEDSILYKTGDLGLINTNMELEYIGRIDTQIKIRGLRVELSEIESQLLNIDHITNCSVIYKEEEKAIVAFIVSDSCTINISDLRELLKLSLPLYMVPKQIIQIDKLPITLNGKIDKKALYNYKIKNEGKRNIVKPTTDEEKICCNIWKNLLGIEIGITDNIFEFGADSLLAIKFKTQLLAYNINIPYANIFKYPTIKELCNKSHITSSKKIDSYNYSNINKLLENNNIKHTTYVNNCTNNNVLLLGSNGFIGMHIIYSFIKNDTGKIYCIVRDKNQKSSYNRFIDILHFYFRTELDEYIGKRIFILNGNILKENFDLSNKNIDILNNEIDVIINSAAIVKHYGNEKTFFDINVGSTKIAIDFCNKYNKRLLHISSLSVSGNNSLVGNTYENEISDNMSFTENNLYIGQNLDNLYINSKFESEKIVLENIITNKLNAQILRLGNITSRFSDGKFQINPDTNAFYNRLKTLIKIGYIPDNLLSSYIEFTPVDICSDVIVLLMQNYVKSFTVFHIYNNNHIYINKFLEYLNQLNVDTKLVSSKEFADIINTILKNNSANIDGIINDFDNNKIISYNSNIKIYSEFTRMFLYLLNFNWPIIDIEYIKKYLKNLNLI